MREYVIAELRDLLKQYVWYQTEEFAHMSALQADGVFLWLRLVVQKLKINATDCCSLEELEEQARCLPLTLADMYIAMWARLNDTKSSNHQLAPQYLNIAVLHQHLPKVYSRERGSFGTLSTMVMLVGTDDRLQEARELKGDCDAETRQKWQAGSLICVSNIRTRCAGILEASYDDPLDDVYRPFRSIYCVKFTHRTAYDFLFEHDAGKLIRQMSPVSELTQLLSVLRAYLAITRIVENVGCSIEIVFAPLAVYLKRHQIDEHQVAASPEILTFWKECLDFFRQEYFADRFFPPMDHADVWFYLKTSYTPFHGLILSSISKSSHTKTIATSLLRLIGSWECLSDEVPRGQSLGPETTFAVRLRALSAVAEEKGSSSPDVWDKTTVGSICQYSTAAAEVPRLVLQMWSGCTEPVMPSNLYKVGRVQKMFNAMFTEDSDYNDLVPVFYDVSASGRYRDRETTIAWHTHPRRPTYDGFDDEPVDTTEEYRPKSWSKIIEEQEAGFDGSVSAGRFEYLYYRRFQSSSRMQLVILINVTFAIRMIARRIAADKVQPDSRVPHIMEQLAPGSTKTEPIARLRYVDMSEYGIYRANLQDEANDYQDLVQKCTESLEMSSGTFPYDLEDIMGRLEKGRVHSPKSILHLLAIRELGFITSTRLERMARMKKSHMNSDAINEGDLDHIFDD